MSATRLPAFDSTLHVTNTWLNDLMERLDWQDRRRAYHALGAVLHALRDRLSVEQAAALGAQLPLLIRGLYYEGWHPGGKPLKERRKDQFLAHVSAAFRGDDAPDPEAVTRAVFAVIARHVSDGAVEHLTGTLPGALRSLWAEDPHTVWF